MSTDEILLLMCDDCLGESNRLSADFVVGRMFLCNAGGRTAAGGGVFSDHMVLQRQVPVRICGQAAAGAAVPVSQPQAVWYVCSQRGKYRLFLASGLPVGTFRPDSGVIPQDQIRK
jgi:hypothetical protein